MPRYQRNWQNGTYQHANGAQPPPYSDGSDQQQDYTNLPSRTNNEPPTERSTLLVYRKETTSRRKTLVMVLLCLLLGYTANTFFHQEWHNRLDRKIEREERQREIRRVQWQDEVLEHEDRRIKMNLERDQWDREEEEKADQKRRQTEEEYRQRESIAWSDLHSGHCLRYGVREYIATLTNVPHGFNAIEECHRKSVEIHGRSWLPTNCADQGVCGRVTGHWNVDANEGGCTPWWSYFKDKGCVEAGIRRHEAPLENLQNGDNWQEMCSTTPANINGIHYDGPTSCADWGKYGKWGIWLIPDSGCW